MDVARLLHTPAFSLRDAPPAEGHFPLVIYAPGYWAIPLTRTSTAEYLASHGYVVAMSPSPGESALRMTFDTAGQEQGKNKKNGLPNLAFRSMKSRERQVNSVSISVRC